MLASDFLATCSPFSSGEGAWPKPYSARSALDGCDAAPGRFGFAGCVISWYACPMETPRHPGRLFGRLVEALKGIATKLRREKPPALVGLPSSARGLTGRPADPALHAKEVAREWEDVAEYYIQEGMRQLGIPDHQIGAPDYQRGGVRRVFLADEAIGGSYGTAPGDGCSWTAACSTRS